MRRDGGDNQGFTLIEVLVAVTILAMIFAIVFGSFFYLVKNADEQEERAQLYHKATFVLNNFSQNVSSAYIPFGGRYGLEDTESEDSESGDTEQEPFLGLATEDLEKPVDSLGLFTTNPRFSAPALAGEIAYVTYGLADESASDEPFTADENNPFVLGCSVTPLLSAQNGAEEEKTASSPQWTMNIRSLKLEYFDGAEWASEWSYKEQEKFPSAVKAVLELADSNGTPHSFSTIASIPVNTTLEETEPETETGTEETEEEDTEEEQPTDLQPEDQTGPPTDGGSDHDSGGNEPGREERQDPRGRLDSK